jgi:16S rRNA (guanine527-N7)-methyltransferase
MIATLLAQLDIGGAYADNLNDFINMVERWNRHINLTAAKSRAEIADHVEDCLHVIPHLAGRQRVLDVGSGGGFPAVIEAICLPGASITALEPTHKKHAFLRACARELRLPNLIPLAERVADHGVTDYDAATSRATFDLVEWLALGRGLVRPDGVVIGFEATPRSDLPAGAVRHPYALGDRTRALVML